MKKLYLVDVSSMFFRAFYAIPPLTNDKGMPTNALYGFLSMTLKLLRQIRPDYLGYCFDRKEPSFRHEIYSDYKANRAEMPEDLVPQVPYIRKLAEVLGIRCLDAPGFEADDVIGTYTEFGRTHNLDVVIVSGDKDFAQLVNSRVAMLDTMKDQRFDESAVVAKWGIKPEQMIDYLSLVGDSSDNVPGVAGIGPKGAQKLLSEFQTLEGVYENLDKISGKSLKQKLIDGKESAFLSRRLVTIQKDIPIEIHIDDLKVQPLHMPDVTALLEELGFKSVLKTLQNSELAGASKPSSVEVIQTSSPQQMSLVGTHPENDPTSTHTRPRAVRTNAGAIRVIDFEEFMRDLKAYTEVYLLETGRGLYIGHKKTLALVPAGDAGLGERFSSLLLSFIGFDLKETWKAVGIKDPVAGFDAQLAAYVIRGQEVKDFAETYEQFSGEKVPDFITPESFYECFLHLERLLRDELAETHGKSVLERIELPTAEALYSMEQYGIRLDAEVLRGQSVGLGQDLQKLEKQIFEMSGGSFNIGSPKQLAQILFEKLKLPVIKKTKTGFSTDNDVLEKLKAEHPIAAVLIDYRELSKLKSTYVDALPSLIHSETGRIHTRFRQAATSTGRLSSVNPNLQNIPIRSERGRAIRKAFIADPGHCLVSADYSQIELRILAHITGDPALVEAFQKDLDIHAATASEIFDVPLDKVDAEHRRAAKAVNFGIAYGQGAFGLSESLGVSRTEATNIIGRYFARFQKVREYMDQTVQVAHEKGYVETLFGRRRYLPELKNKNKAIQKFGERAAINSPIQGTASDLVKLAMIEVYRSSAFPILLQVHDELVLEGPKDQVETEIPRIRVAMESAYELRVPLKVNIAAGDNWEDAHS